jgi:hypothetical protein
MTLLTKLATMARVQIARLGSRRNERLIFIRVSFGLRKVTATPHSDISLLVWPLLT